MTTNNPDPNQEQKSNQMIDSRWPMSVHIALVVGCLAISIYLFSGISGYDIPASITALGVLLGGNSLGHIFANLNKRPLKMRDRLFGVFALFGLSLTAVRFLFG